MMMVVTMLSDPWAGWFIGKFGPRAIIAGNIICASGLFLLALHSHLWQSYVAYGVLIGLGASIGGKKWCRHSPVIGAALTLNVVKATP